ncbi:MAG: aminotransferase class IV [Alphaproteobacteria bacterium]|nr:aminotransferase class IV [Alphaproteobacteria bacterium]
MTDGWARVNGRLSPLDEAAIPATDRGFQTGWTVFETALALDGRIPHLDLHLARLAASCAEALVPMPAGLADEILDVAGRIPGRAKVRVQLSGTGVRVVMAEPVSLARFGAPVRCVRGPLAEDPFLSGAVKHGSRAGWMAAVERAGVDDVLFVDADGRFTEGTTCGVIAVVDGKVYAAPADGRILASTTVTRLLEIAEEQGIPVVRQGALAAGPWDGLYIASATRGLAPVATLDGEALPSGEPVGRALLEGLARAMEQARL